MSHTLQALHDADPEVYAAVVGEMRRQEENLELIASENIVSQPILEATGSVLTNKYAEGPPGRRYYGGCEMVDVVEHLACARARALFGAEYANVQPHSGTQANMAVYMSVLKPGDTMLAMDLDAGGHLTHGSPVNFSGKLYRIIAYGVRRENERIDYDAVRAQALEHRPKLLVAGASAYPRSIDFARFGEIARECGAKLLVDMAHIAGLVACGEHPSPFPHADYVTTTTHKTLRGPRGGLILARAEYGKALDSAVCPLTQGGPLCHVIAAKAVALRDAQKPGFKQYQQQVRANAVALGEGLAAHGFRLVSGGTENHMVLVDLRNKRLTGKVAERALDLAGITVNKNKVPFDPEKPLVTSGIRLGTPAVTTRGMKTEQMRQVADLVHAALLKPDDAKNLAQIKDDVIALTARYPMYRSQIDALPSAQAM
jgi:glycine hydroxymethyltransferase